MAKKFTITKTEVDKAEIPASGEARLWDEELRGFCLRVYSTGRKVYAVKYRVGRTQRWFTIGAHGSPWTPDTAREKAKGVIRDASVGVDHHSAKVQRRDDITVSQLVELYLADGPASKPTKRASSWMQDRSELERHIRPLIGKKIARDVTKADVQRMARQITDGATAADIKTEKKRGRAIIKGGAGVAERAVTTFGAMYAWAIETDVIGRTQAGDPINPAKGIKLPRRAAVERFLSPKEAATLVATIEAMLDEKKLDATQADIFTLLLLTGARRSEISGLRWPEVGLDRNRLTLPPDRSKAGGKTGERRIALNTEAKAILAKRLETKAKGAEFVFPALRGDGGHVVGLQKPWDRVRARAGLGGLRLHDLRHSFASFAVADGASLYMVGKALGHANSSTTERYAHLSDDPLQELAEAAGRRMKVKPNDF